MPRWFGWVSTSLIDRLVTRLRLQETPINPESAFILKKVILPVTNIDDLLKITEIKSALVSITSATTFNVLIVPGTQRWQVLAYSIYKVTGTWTFNEISLYDNIATESIPIDSIGASVTARQQRVTGELYLEKSFSLQVVIDTWGVIGNMQVKLLVRREDTF